MSRLMVLVAKALGDLLQLLLSRPAGAVLRRLDPPTRRFGEALRARLRRVGDAVPAWAYPPGFFVLAVSAGALLLVLRQVDRALRQMHLPGEPGGGALAFPRWFGAAHARDAAQTLRQSWLHYQATMPDTRPLAAPRTLVHQLVGIDLIFVVVYAMLLTMLLVLLIGANGHLTDRFVPARRRWLQAAGITLVLLVLLDIAEDMLLLLAFGTAPGTAAANTAAVVGPYVSLAKLMSAVLVLVPMMLTAIAYLIGRPGARRAAVSVRAVLVELGLLVAVLLIFGLGKNQTDDVVRAWDAGQAFIALVAGVAAALVVTGVTAYLTGDAIDRPAPDTGPEDPQPLALGAGVAALLVGLVMNALGAGWGLMVPGAMLILVWLLGLPLAGVETSPPPSEPAAPTEPAAPAAPAEPLDESGDDDRKVAAAGRVLATALGAAVLAVLIWVISRASAFDLFVRASTPRWGWTALVIAVCTLLMAAGAALVGLHGRIRRTGWPYLTVAALLLGMATMAPGLQITLPARGGSVAVMLTFVALLVGVTGWIVGGVRSGPLRRYCLVPAVRSVGFRRFPVLLFILVWFVALSVIDQGGYHDIRRIPAANPGPPPTLEQAFRSWQQVAPARPARPLVIVAAQGGGMRAAVWTALVMECVFGPGPVRTEAPCAEGDAAQVDRERAGSTVRAEPLPVFLASGASGGSVGLAAWSARRMDLAAGGSTAEGTPATVEEALGMDFLAPNLARWFVGDLSYAFLGHHWPDRAAVLEQAWERPWSASGTGLSRGMRATYELAVAGNRWQLPVLAFNGASVEDGCRFLSSPVDFAIARADGSPAAGATADGTPMGPDGTLDTPSDSGCRSAERSNDGALADALPVTGELVDYLCPGQDVPLSTAAHLSARFPYISPTGRIERQPCQDAPHGGLVEEHAVSFDADGGLFDNSGALTALEAWQALSPLAAHDETEGAGCVVPIFLQIDNGVQDGASTGPDRKPSEIAAPLNALLGEIGSRDSYGRAAAATAFTAPVSPGGREITLDGSPLDQRWFHIALFGQPGPQPPLGWTLAASTVVDMRAQLGATPNRDQIDDLRKLLTGALSCT
jgi:hypothetical protein